MFGLCNAAQLCLWHCQTRVKCNGTSANPPCSLAPPPQTARAGILETRPLAFTPFNRRHGAPACSICDAGACDVDVHPTAMCPRLQRDALAAVRWSLPRRITADVCSLVQDTTFPGPLARFLLDLQLGPLSNCVTVTPELIERRLDAGVIHWEEGTDVTDARRRNRSIPLHDLQQMAWIAAFDREYDAWKRDSNIAAFPLDCEMAAWKGTVPMRV